MKELNVSGNEANVLSLTLRGVVNNDPEDPEGLVPTDYASYQLFNRDDLVFKLIDLENVRTSRVGIVHERGIMSPAYIRLVCSESLDPRYAYYWYYSLYVRHIYNHMGAGVRANLGAADLLNLQILVPPLEEQRRIADFLDDQITRINRVRALSEMQLAALQETQDGVFHDVLSQLNCKLPTGLDQPIGSLPKGWRVAELGHTLRQLTNGYVGPTRDILVDEGVPYIQSLHVKDGGINFDRRPYYVSAEWHQERPRIHLREGDLLIVQTGDIGQVAMVPADFGEASCHALQIARVEPLVIKPDYLGEYLRSRFGRHQLLCRATGALHPHLESGIKAAPVVLPPIRVQHDIVGLCAQRRKQVHDASQALIRRDRVLDDYRKSLITAAVTGELDVATARRGVPA